MALATANAATLQGSVGGGYQYTTSGTDTSTQEALANDVADASSSSWSWTDRSIYDTKFQPHVDTVKTAAGPTWTDFKTAHGGDDDFIGKYVDEAAVSPDFKT